MIILSIQDRTRRQNAFNRMEFSVFIWLLYCPTATSVHWAGLKPCPSSLTNKKICKIQKEHVTIWPNERAEVSQMLFMRSWNQNKIECSCLIKTFSGLIKPAPSSTSSFRLLPVSVHVCRWLDILMSVWQTQQRGGGKWGPRAFPFEGLWLTDNFAFAGSMLMLARIHRWLVRFPRAGAGSTSSGAQFACHRTVASAIIS